MKDGYPNPLPRVSLAFDVYFLQLQLKLLHFPFPQNLF